MKKCVWLIAGLLLLTSCSSGKNPEVFTAESKPYTVNIVCFGNVESANDYDIVLPKGTIITQYLVEKGDRVSSGEKLLSVERSGARYDMESEFDGVISSISLAAGTPSDGKKSAITVLRTDELRLNVDLSESDMRAVSVGNKVEITGDGFSGESYDGSVAKIYSLAKQESGGVYVQAAIDILNPDESVLPGLSARASIVCNSVQDAVVVPLAAVGYDTDGYYVYNKDRQKLYLNSVRKCTDGYALNGVKGGTVLCKSVSEVENAS